MGKMQNAFEANSEFLARHEIKKVSWLNSSPFLLYMEFELLFGHCVYTRRKLQIGIKI